MDDTLGKLSNGCVHRAQETLIDEAMGVSLDGTDEEAQACRLAFIASRNELLAALKALVDDLEARWDMRDPRTNPGIRDCVEHAKAAIAKAEGR